MASSCLDTPVRILHQSCQSADDCEERGTGEPKVNSCGRSRCWARIVPNCKITTTVDSGFFGKNTQLQRHFCVRTWATKTDQDELNAPNPLSNSLRAEFSPTST